MRIKLLPFFFGFLACANCLIAGELDIRNDAEFKKILPPASELRKLTGGLRFCEGPVWVPRKGGYLILSDIPGDELKVWTTDAGIGVFRSPSHNANGNTIDLKKRLITCEHSGRRVVLQEKDGKIKTLVDHFNGKKLNSPNDVVVKSDGTIWFTDPPYGVSPKEKELPGNYVFRFNPKDSSLKTVATDFDHPNGLCFSPDEKKLYIADSGDPRHIRVFNVAKDGTLADGKVFCSIDKGVPDGIRCDKDGRVWSTAGDGVQIFLPTGELIGKILVPETPANLCFGGKNSKTLFITARTSLYAIEVNVKGAK